MAQQQGPSSSTQTGMGMQGQGNTGVDNTTFNVISVVYHALQGAETIQKYLRDAQGGGQHPDVEQFLREAQEQNKRLAQRGQECLQNLMQQQGSSRQQMQSGGGSQMGGAGGSQGGGQLSQGSGSQSGGSKSSGARK